MCYLPAEVPRRRENRNNETILKFTKVLSSDLINLTLRVRVWYLDRKPKD